MTPPQDSKTDLSKGNKKQTAIDNQKKSSLEYIKRHIRYELRDEPSIRELFNILDKEIVKRDKKTLKDIVLNLN